LAAKYNYNEYITQEIKEEIPKWKRQGQTDRWIAKKLGIGITKLGEWRKEKPELAELFKKGREDLLLDLEETLYTRAKGYTRSNKEYQLDEKGRVIKSSIKVKETFIWSDSCLMMALRKLDPKKWGEKEDLKITPTTISEFINNLTPEQLEEVMKNVKV